MAVSLLTVILAPGPQLLQTENGVALTNQLYISITDKRKRFSLQFSVSACL